MIIHSKYSSKISDSFDAFNDIVFEDVFSIGCDCTTAITMIRMGLRKYSGPLDWVRGGTFRARMELLINGFKKYLDYNLISVKSSEDEHIVFNTLNNIEFVHDFSDISEFESVFKSVKIKYLRCINRFYSRLKSSKNLLLIYTSKFTLINSFEIAELHAKLIEKFGNNIYLIVIENDINQFNIKTEKINDKILKYTLNLKTLDENGRPLIFKRMFLFDTIFDSLKVKGKFIRKWKRKILRPLTNIIPFSNMRTAVRKFLNINNTNF